MRKRLGRIGVMASMICLMSGLISCPHENPQALLVLDAIAMTTQTQCTIRPGGSAQVIRPFGILDLAFSNSYWLFPRFQNMLPTLTEITGESPASLQPAETNYLSLYSADRRVDIGDDFFNRIKNEEDWTTATTWIEDGYPCTVAATAAPNEQAVTAVQIVAPELGNLMDAKIQEWLNEKSTIDPGTWITAYVQLKAVTQDIQHVLSNEFRFPIQVCWGCLCLCSSNTPSVPKGTEVPCFPGQDDTVAVELWPMMANHPEVCTDRCW